MCQSLPKRFMICSKITKNIVKKYKTAQKYCNSTIYKLKTFIISLAKILLSTVNNFDNQQTPVCINLFGRDFVFS